MQISTQTVRDGQKISFSLITELFRIFLKIVHCLCEEIFSAAHDCYMAQFLSEGVKIEELTNIFME